MDFKIDINTQPADMTWEKETTILNNIWLSLNIEKGSFFLDPEFGLASIRPGKNTEANAARVKENIQKALKWITDAGRATDIQVYTQIDKSENINRLKALIRATQADGRVVTFDKFFEVI